MKKRKKTIISLLIVLLIICILFISLIILKPKEKINPESLLKELGKDFYENYYYKKIAPTDEERKEKVSQYKELGIKISINNLIHYHGEEKFTNFINPKTKEPCNRETSKIIIYPNGNFTNKDYTIKINLECK